MNLSRLFINETIKVNDEKPEDVTKEETEKEESSKEEVKKDGESEVKE